MVEVSLFINGKRYRAQVESETRLLWVLRDTPRLKGTKYGCGMGLCGACTVHLDGEPTRSCLTPVASRYRRRRSHLAPLFAA